jgi:hypothetical protein
MEVDQIRSLLGNLGVILIGFAIFTHAEVWGADWKYFGAGGDGIFWWYDAQGITYQPNRIIHVWVKKVKADEIKDMVESGAKVTLSELEQMTSERDYERSLMEIDCVKKTVNHLQKLNYDSKGVLKIGESKLGAKESIPTDSVAERLYQAVCK